MNDQQHSRAGWIMILLAWIIVFAGLLFFFSWSRPSGSKVYSATSSEYIVGADLQGHYFIKGQINQHPVTFLVDTGATLVAIPQNLADKMQLVGRASITMSTANGDVDGSLTRLGTLDFGQFNLKNVKAVIMPKDEDETVLLGMNVLSCFNIVQENNRLILKKKTD